MAAVFPFSAIVGQDEMKLALLIASVDPSVGGVLIFGDRGTGKSTAVRALAALLPTMRAVVGCPYGCDPAKVAGLCGACDGTADKPAAASKSKAASAAKPAAGPRSHAVPVPVVDLPLGATEDRVVGALDLERALAHGQ
ncbi:MAG: magnesium chelatase ATPase subunit I, partial [Pseudomonadota bacterium]